MKLIYTYLCKADRNWMKPNTVSTAKGVSCQMQAVSGADNTKGLTFLVLSTYHDLEQKKTLGTLRKVLPTKQGNQGTNERTL